MKSANNVGITTTEYNENAHISYQFVSLQCLPFVRMSPGFNMKTIMNKAISEISLLRKNNHSK